MRRRIHYLQLLVAMTLPIGPASLADADVPPPPVNQHLGFPDTIRNPMTETLCRACHVDHNFILERHHFKVGRILREFSDAPFSSPTGVYACSSCHGTRRDPDKGEDVLDVSRDCLHCHWQLPGKVGVHHRTPRAVRHDCKGCHGLIDNPLDGHYIPIYAPSLVTPRPGQGFGPDGVGGCEFCHREGLDVLSGVQVRDNANTHHAIYLMAGPFTDFTMRCGLCHDLAIPPHIPIRACEKCHGIGSLHNIQMDSNGDGIHLGEENPYYGHIGCQKDCWGCHGFSLAAASDPPVSCILPHISEVSPLLFMEGDVGLITIQGTAFMDEIDGWNTSRILLTDKYAEDGAQTYINPMEIRENMLDAHMPASIEKGEYAIQLVKCETGDRKTSNAKVIGVTSSPHIEGITCQEKNGYYLTVTGSGFDFSGYDAFMRLEGSAMSVTTKIGEDDIKCTINSWDEFAITAFNTLGCGTDVTVRIINKGTSAPVTRIVLDMCISCHTARAGHVSKTNSRWREHLPEGRVSRSTFELAEKIYLYGISVFTPQEEWPAVNDTPSRELLPADLDGDNDRDVIIVNGRDRQSQIFLNDGSGIFMEATSFHLTPESERTFTGEGGDLADVDGDGDLDVFFTHLSQPNRLYLNDGTGVFADATMEKLPDQVTNSLGADFGDIDKDGDLDLVVANQSGTNKLFLNDGTGAFTDVGSANLPADADESRDVAFADVDGDGDLDILVANARQNRLYMNDGKGLFHDATEASLPPDADLSEKLEVGDIDGDNDLDFVTVNSGSHIKLYVNNGAGLFSARHIIDDEASFSDASLGDYDLDGDPDLLCIHENGLRHFRLFANDGKGIFVDKTEEGLPDIIGAGQDGAFADIDNDGDLDFLVAHGGQNHVYVNDKILDAEPPTIPAGVMAEANFCRRVNLSWDRANDNSRVAGYSLYRNNIKIVDTVEPAFADVDSGLMESASYCYTIEAFDPSGNHSMKSRQICVITPACPSPPADTEVNCIDGIDDDGDGWVDCADKKDCEAYSGVDVHFLAKYFGNPAIPPDVCGDGDGDNDIDGLDLAGYALKSEGRI